MATSPRIEARCAAEGIPTLSTEAMTPAQFDRFSQICAEEFVVAMGLPDD